MRMVPENQSEANVISLFKYKTQQPQASLSLTSVVGKILETIRINSYPEGLKWAIIELLKENNVKSVQLNIL